ERTRSFFFSSRRRHTRFSRDWSSDVCSSDLPGDAGHPHVDARGDLAAQVGEGGADVPRPGQGAVALAAGPGAADEVDHLLLAGGDRKSTRLNSSHVKISYAVFCLKKKKKKKH